MTTRRGVLACGVVAAVLLLTMGVRAQVLQVLGRVTDESGAVVPGATVELRRDGAVQRTVMTDATGQFSVRIDDVSQGTFDVRILVPGGSPGTVRIAPDFTRTTVSVGSFRAEVRALRPVAAMARRGGTAAPPDTVAPPPPPPPPPTPAPAPTPPTVTAAPADTTNHAIVPVFFATDRNRVSYEPLVYGTVRNESRSLYLGRIDVSVPKEHREGQLERPSFWTLWREDPNKHFIVVRARQQTYEEFYRELGDVVGRSRGREVLVFVHGFNVPFESAVYRTAQIAHDLKFDGAPILYSWPSLGSAGGYPTDVNNSESTIQNLHYFLEDVAAKSGATAIHLIAHSRGNWPLINALTNIAAAHRTTPRPRFRQIVLTAPDVDADRFRQLAIAFRGMGERTTLYASANDEALKLSKQYQGYQRAGDVFPQIVTVDGIDSIDVSAVDTSFLGHSYYGDNTSVISDIRRLLQTGLPPERRCLQLVPNSSPRYWTFVAKMVCPI